MEVFLVSAIRGRIVVQRDGSVPGILLTFPDLMSDTKSRARAIFMDRDGTVSEEVGYMYHAGLYRPFPWTGEAIKRINDSGMKAILVTNQSGIERGYFKEST